MVRRHDEPLQVATGEQAGRRAAAAETRHGDTLAAEALHDDAPRSFVWRGRRYTVCAVLDAWQERRAWWREVGEHPDGPTDTERRVWRVEARPPSGTAGVFDLGRDDDHWLLLRAHD